MRTAIDTNAISALWSVDPLVAGILELLADAHRSGGLIIAAPVYAELLAHPRMMPHHVDEFLASTAVSIDFQMNEEVWRMAGNRFARYAARRRVARVGQPRRLIADFVIGAHALLLADRLLTLDVSIYEREFPELKIVTCP